MERLTEGLIMMAPDKAGEAGGTAAASDSESTTVNLHQDPYHPQRVTGHITVTNSAGASMKEVPPVQNGEEVKTTDLKPPPDIGIPRWLQADLDD